MQVNPSAQTKETTDKMKYPATVVCPIVTGTASSYVVLAHDFPKNVTSATIKKVFCIGLPETTVNIPIAIVYTAATDWAVTYVPITDSTLLDSMKAYPTLVEIELTYA